MLWNVFSTGLSGAGNSMVSNANIIKKIYFPRLIIPMSAILVAVFDFFMAFIVYVGLVIYYDYSLSIKLIYLSAGFANSYYYCIIRPGRINSRYEREIPRFSISTSLYHTGRTVCDSGYLSRFPWLQTNHGLRISWLLTQCTHQFQLFETHWLIALLI